MDHTGYRHRQWIAVDMLWNAAIAVGFVIILLLPIVTQPR